MLTAHPSRLALPSLLGALLAAAAIAPAAASAATQRYASPSGSGTACSAATPCAITQAISAASFGDEVIVEPGDYPLTATLSDPAQITIHGVAGQPRPRLQFSGAGQIGTGVRVDSGSTLRYVEIDEAEYEYALFSSGSVVDQVLVRGPYGAEIQNSTIRDSIVVASGANGAAVTTDANGATNTSIYRNVTAIATGSGGVAINAHALGVNGDVTINLVNVIAWAGPGTAASLKVSTDSSGAHATINSTHSDYGTEWFSGSNTAITSSGGDLSNAPTFVNPAAGDYHEAAGSETVDAGVNDPPNGSVDVDGDPRTIGTTDIGADEFVLAPTAATGPAGTIGAQTATLSGTVNPEGAPTSYRFQYGTTSAYGSTTGPTDAGAGAADVAASAAISGLSPSTTYHYRIEATNAAGVTHGADQTFTAKSSPPPTSTPTPTPTPSPTPTFGFAGVKLTSTTLGIAHGFVTAWLKCPAATVGRCTGRAQLTIRHPRTPSRAAYTVRLGRLTFTIAAGKRIKIRIRASRAALTLFTTARRHKATATIRARDGAGKSKTTVAAVTIRRRHR